MNFKHNCLIILFIVFFPFCCLSQFNRLGGGLAFSSGVDYNYGSTGNPGILLKAYYKINNRFYLSPDLTVFNRFNKGDAYYSLNSYMFHFNIDGQYGIIKDNQLVVFCLAGLNATTIISRYKLLENVGQNTIDNASAIKPGLNIGAGVKMYINKSFDGVLTGKYIAGEFSQMVISIGVVYYLDGNNRKSW